MLPFAPALVVTVKVASVIVMVTALLPVPPSLVALTVTMNVPLAVGVPEIRPVLVFTLNPAGNPLAP